ncbi:MAG: hypothetical protein JWM59_1744 [Verrucomicrobiales bacterium]|nr:hypothetical protein [Verrucomicrobiales bacterium]
MKPALLLIPVAASAVFAADLITPGDPALAIDRDLIAVINSDYPSNDSAASAIDRRTDTKYANTGGLNSGIIITPAAGSSTVRSFVITTASDVPDRDPASWELYGTNDVVSSTDNSRGDAENWTLIESGTLDLPAARLTAGAAVAVTNETAYTSYRILFPTLRNAAAGILQFAEIQLYSTPNGSGAPVLSQNDAALAINLPALDSRSPDAEQVQNVLDSDPATKYLNFGKINTGFIVTPAAGATVAQSLIVTTANDAVERDPASWVLYGTNDDIVTEAHSTGDGENWTEIARGDLALPAERLTPGPLVPFDNVGSWKSYRLVFPTLKNAPATNSMQVADVQLYTTEDGSDAGIFSADDAIIPIQRPYTRSGYRTNNEKPQNVVDGLAETKYLNFGELNSGIIVTPTASSTVRSLVITTANDSPERDPSSYALYGTNDPITSGDNSTGSAENWTLISRGPLALPDARNTAGPAVSFSNSTAYTSYRLIFPGVKNNVAANSLQIAEVQLYPQPDGAGTGILAPTNAVKAIKVPSSVSNYPQQENPANVLDGDPNTKYLNGAKRNTGFIVTPAAGAKVVQSFSLSTANDVPERDPASYALYGTNDPVVSGDNSDGSFENWTLVASGGLSLTDERLHAAVLPDEAVSFPNTTAYTSWRLVFPTVKNDTVATAMQAGDVQFYTGQNGGGGAVLAVGDEIRAIAFINSASGSNPNETVDKAVDSALDTKYLNTGGVNSGLIVTPAGGSSVVTGLRLFTANDFEGRDPAAYELYGTNDPITSVNNSVGNAENWTLISSGPIELPADRNGAEAAVSITNSTAWTSYRFVVTALKDNAQGLMQFSELQLPGEFGPVTPADPSFKITGVSTTGSPIQNVTLTWASEAGASYTVQTSTALSGWTAAGNPVTATGTSTTATVPVTAGERRFFRVVKN